MFDGGRWPAGPQLSSHWPAGHRLVGLSGRWPAGHQLSGRWPVYPVILRAMEASDILQRIQRVKSEFGFKSDRY